MEKVFSFLAILSISACNVNVSNSAKEGENNTSTTQSTGTEENYDAAFADGTAVATTEKSGVFTAKLSSKADTTQIINTKSSEMENASLALPVGALSLDATIMIREGETLSASDLNSLDIDVATSKQITRPLAVWASPSSDLSNPGTLALDIGNSGTLQLQENSYFVAANFFKSSENKFYLAMIPADKIQIVGQRAYFQIKYFGKFVIFQNSGSKIKTYREVPMEEGDSEFANYAADFKQVSEIEKDSGVADSASIETTLDSKPSPISSQNTASFTFSCNDENATFLCNLDLAPFAPCTSPYLVSDVTDGPHTFQVKAVDAAGSADETPETYSWVIDTVSPAAIIDSKPASVSTSNSATFSFSSSEVDGVFLCALDEENFAPCTSPMILSSLAEGTHTFYVKVRDVAGNESPSAANYGWLIDSVKPSDVSGLTATPGLGKVTLSWSHTGTDVVSFDIEISSGGTGERTVTWPTTSYQWTGLTNGTNYQFTVHAVDAVGNRSLDGVTQSATPTNSLSCTDKSTITGDSYTRYFDVSGNYLFFELGDSYGTFKVYDVSDPTSPSETGSLALESGTGCWYAGGVALSPNPNYAYIYGGGCNGVPVIDISNKASPAAVRKAALPGGTMDIDICGNYLYMALQSRGVAVYDITEPDNPVDLIESVISGSKYPYGVTCWIKDATTTYVYLGDGGSSSAAGLRVYEHNKSAKTLTPKGTYLVDTSSWGGRGVAYSENILYMMWSNTSKLAVFNLSNKESIPAPSTISGAGSSNADPILDNGFLFSPSSTGWAIYDLSTPTTPTSVLNKTISGYSLNSIKRASIGASNYVFYTANNANWIKACQLSGF